MAALWDGLRQSFRDCRDLLWFRWSRLPWSRALCQCKDRPARKCPGAWESGCDFGANEKHARAYRNPSADAAVQDVAEAKGTE